MLSENMIDDISKIILDYAGCRIPLKTLQRVDSKALFTWNYCRRHVEAAWMGRGWTPSNCNRLVMASFNHQGKRYLDQLQYTALTGLTPTRKKYVRAHREAKGFHPIYPGERQYPTSRVRFWPKYHTNDRYFR